MSHQQAQPSRVEGYPHAGAGHGVSNVITFVVMLILFFGGFYAFSFFLDGWWSFALGLFLCCLALFVPMTFMGRSDSHQVTVRKKKP